MSQHPQHRHLGVASFAPLAELPGSGESLVFPLASEAEAESINPAATYIPEAQDSEQEDIGDRDEFHQLQDYPDESPPPTDRLPEFDEEERLVQAQEAIEQSKTPAFTSSQLKAAHNMQHTLFHQKYAASQSTRITDTDNHATIQHSDKRRKSVDGSSVPTALSSLPLNERQRSDSFSGLPEDQKRKHTVQALLRVLQQAVKQDNDSAEAHVTLGPLACAIEEACFKHFQGITNYYRCHVRDLLANISDPANPSFRHRLLTGSLSPHQTAILSNEDMANRELHELRAIFRAEDLKNHLDPGDSAEGKHILVSNRRDGVGVRTVRNGHVVKEEDDDYSAEPGEDKLL